MVADPRLAHHFESLRKQAHANRLGMDVTPYNVYFRKTSDQLLVCGSAPRIHLFAA